MIIKNVIVYTEDKKFTAGGIVVHDDTPGGPAAAGKPRNVIAGGRSR